MGEQKANTIFAYCSLYVAATLGRWDSAGGSVGWISKGSSNF